MCTLHAITHRKCSKGPYLIFLFSFFIKCQWVMPDVSLTGEDVNPNAARVLAQTRRKAPVWPSAKRSCFSFSNCSLMCQKKEEKKRKERKKNRFMLYRGSDALVFFCFFLECRSGWSRSLRNWNGECWNSWKGTKTRAGRKEKEDPGEKKHEKGIRNEYVGCHVAASPDLKTKTSQAQRLMQPLNLLRLDDNKL